MDGRVICRAMIYSYRELEQRCKRIDIIIYNTAIHSAFKNTMETYKEIERLTREKIAYINVKVIIDQALVLLKGKYEFEQHHIKGESVEQIATTLNVKWHTVETRLIRQRAKLYENILKRYSGEELLDIICDSGWLMSLYKRELRQKPRNEPKTGDK